MLQPKRTKYRKAFKGRIRGAAKGGFNLDFGAYLLAQLLAPAAGTPSAEQVRLAAIGYNGGDEMLRDHLAGQRALWPETERYSRLLSQLWAEREAESSATYRALVAR